LIRIAGAEILPTTLADVECPWGAWLKMAHMALAAVLACYLLMVATNSWLFGYNFWNEPPPSQAADTFAVASLVALFVAASFIGAVTYSWMCEFASAPAEGLAEPFGRARAATLRRWWIAVPGFALTLLGCLFLFPGVVAVALLGPLPFVAENRRLRDELPSLYRDLESLMTTGAVVAFTVAATVWLAVIVGGDLVERFDGAVEVAALVLAYVAYLSSAVAAGWAAFRFVAAS
jgi:hypothetical protein